MKKHVFLTSLFAISLSCGAHAATDVTFAGGYTLADGETTGSVTEDAPVVTYEYDVFKGKDGVETKSGQSLDDVPQKDSFSYINPQGENSSLADLTDENAPQITEYTGVTAADNETIITTQEIVAGVTAERENYTYKNAAGETVTLGEKAPDFTETVTLDNGRDIVVKNGEAEEFDGTQYSFIASDGNLYTLNRKGDTLVSASGAKVDPAETDLGDELQQKYDEIKTAFEADTKKLANAKQTTQAAYDADKALFDAADEVFKADSKTIETLTNNYNSIEKAKEAFATAEAKHAAALEKQDTEDALYAAAKDLFNAPIETTITNGANSAIDASLESGSLKDALAEKASVKDVADNTTAIAANKQAIADEADARKAADEKLAKDIKAGDEMTLAKAKAYADDQSAMALKSANNYTDKKVSALKKELSAGIASATAMSSIEVSNVAKGEVSVGGGYGYYNSQSAVAFGAAMGLTDNWSVNAAAGLADSNVSFRAGTNYKFKLF